jgi:hypothetical protein
VCIPCHRVCHPGKPSLVRLRCPPRRPRARAPSRTVRSGRPALSRHTSHARRRRPACSASASGGMRKRARRASRRRATTPRMALAAHRLGALSRGSLSAPSPVLIAWCYASITQRVAYGRAHARACAKGATAASHHKLHASLSPMSGAAAAQTRPTVQGIGGCLPRPSPGRPGARNVTGAARTHQCAVRAGGLGLWRHAHVNAPKETARRAAVKNRPARFPGSGGRNARSWAARITTPWPSS